MYTYGFGGYAFKETHFEMQSSNDRAWMAWVGALGIATNFPRNIRSIQYRVLQEHV